MDESFNVHLVCIGAVVVVVAAMPMAESQPLNDDLVFDALIEARQVQVFDPLFSQIQPAVDRCTVDYQPTSDGFELAFPGGTVCNTVEVSRGWNVSVSNSWYLAFSYRVGHADSVIPSQHGLIASVHLEHCHDDRGCLGRSYALDVQGHGRDAAGFAIHEPNIVLPEGPGEIRLTIKVSSAVMETTFEGPGVLTEDANFTVSNFILQHFSVLPDGSHPLPRVAEHDEDGRLVSFGAFSLGRDAFTDQSASSYWILLQLGAGSEIVSIHSAEGEPIPFRRAPGILERGSLWPSWWVPRGTPVVEVNVTSQHETPNPGLDAILRVHTGTAFKLVDSTAIPALPVLTAVVAITAAGYAAAQLTRFAKHAYGPYRAFVTLMGVGVGAAALLLIVPTFSTLLMGWFMELALWPLSTRSLAVYGVAGAGIFLLVAVGIMVGHLWQTTLRYDVQQSREAGVRHKSEADSMKSLAYSVSHDLKTPLVSMNWLLEDFAHGRSKKEFEQTRGLMRGNLRQMKSFMDDVLALVSIDAIDERSSRADLIDVVTDVSEGLTSVFLQRDTRLHLDIPDTLPVLGPAAVWRPVIHNLLSNANKYGRVHGGSVWLKIRHVAGDVVISVEDDGPGVPDEHKQRVFEMFDRGAAASGTIEGTGVGLALVQKVAKAYGGEAFVTDRPGGGARFVVQLPAERALAGNGAGSVASERRPKGTPA